MDLNQTSQLLRLLADGTRMRLLTLLESEELTVAELAAVTQLAQPRVSTHLAKLREAEMVRDRRAGVSAYYRLALDVADPAVAGVWAALKQGAHDPLIDEDQLRLQQVLAARADANNWADSVAGDMERHYSPGRTWEATARAMVRLLQLGRVLDVASGDGVLAELLVDRADHIHCLDISPRVVEAGKQRLSCHPNVSFEVGDMHNLPISDASFDVVLMMHALTYSQEPQKAFNEAARVLTKNGVLLASTLHRHRHQSVTDPFDHANAGFSRDSLRKHCETAGLAADYLQITSREKRAPHFEVVTLVARKKA